MLISPLGTFRAIMLDTKKTTYDLEDLKLTPEAQSKPEALLAQKFLHVILSTPYMGHNSSRLKSLMLALYNSQTYPADLQCLTGLAPPYLEEALTLLSYCLTTGTEPHVFFENGVLLFASILPKWGRVLKNEAGFSQQDFLRGALKTLKLTREQLSETLGVSKRGLDKWLLPDDSPDARYMPPSAQNQVRLLLRVAPSSPLSLGVDKDVLGMRLVCKAFALLGRDRFKVSAELSLAEPETLKNFADFKSILLMAYEEGTAQPAAAESTSVSTS